MGRIFLVLALVTYIGVAQAGSITLSDFGPHRIVESFDDLALLTGQLDTPVQLNGNTYNTSSGSIRLFTPASGGSIECLGGSGSCIGTGLLDLESITAVLTVPAFRAGLWVGLGTDASAATVDFIDEGDSLIGSVQISLLQGLTFVAWEVDSPKPKTRIAKITVNDTALNSRVTVIDDLTWETRPVSEPSSLLSIAGMLIALAPMHQAQRKRSRRSAAE